MEIQIISGFLGAGKTTFLNKYLPLLPGKTVVLENEFGKIGLDGGLIEGDVPVRELSSGCICCSLAADLRTAIREVAEAYAPDRILIEPSGVAMLGDVINAGKGAQLPADMEPRFTKRVTIVDAACFSAYAKGFPFYLEQAENAGIIFLSHLEKTDEAQVAQVVEELRRCNPRAVIYDGDWRKLDGDTLLALIEQSPDPAEGDEPAHYDIPDAENLFTSVSIARPRQLSAADPTAFLAALAEGVCGRVLRAKGYLPCAGGMYYIDLTMSGSVCRPAEAEGHSGGLVVIGSGLDRRGLLGLFV